MAKYLLIDRKKITETAVSVRLHPSVKAKCNKVGAPLLLHCTRRPSQNSKLNGKIQGK